MSSIWVPGYKVDDHEIVGPASGSTSIFPAPLEWTTQSADFQPQEGSHFQIQIATDPGFTNIVEEGLSYVNASRFDYKVGTVWTPLPASGLAIGDIGKNVRYRPAISIAGTFYWRVRQQQFFVDADFASVVVARPRTSTIRMSTPNATSSAGFGTRPWVDCCSPWIDWSVLEASENVFTWGSIDTSFRYAIDHDKQISLRIGMGHDAPDWIAPDTAANGDFITTSLGDVQVVQIFDSSQTPSPYIAPVTFDPILRLHWQRVLRETERFMNTVYNGKRFADVCAWVAVSGPTLVGTEMSIGDMGDVRNTNNWNAILNGTAARQDAHLQAWKNAVTDWLHLLPSVPTWCTVQNMWGDQQSHARALITWATNPANVTPIEKLRLIFSITNMQVDKTCTSYALVRAQDATTISLARDQGFHVMTQSAGLPQWTDPAVAPYDCGFLGAVQKAYKDQAVDVYNSRQMEWQTSIAGDPRFAGLDAWIENTLQPYMHAIP
jgi:hypothetical protein